ncbi:hypothetical protein [Terrihabitans rhizophilus]|uniref:Uncharacterized protein n=1 Tax=Terrihabitans rhizophilus TaxID=3092662 RepID=A0ABU4RUQ0_9HYPH|nr:hypothetical protein [Terrihabitans sp. PJ23]MDX6807345.1 hypothetical protein [Terrihabitans sp. PJ23]
MTRGTGRILWSALLVSAVLLLALLLIDIEVPQDDEEALARVMREEITTPAVEGKLEDALSRGDVEDARMYADLAAQRELPLRPELTQRLTDAEQPGPTAQRNALDFGSGFVTGQGQTIAGLAGAVTSDLTVVGDIRDVVHEGGLMIAGQPYDELMLGLATVGLAATGATVATGGAGLPAKLGVAVLKVARRAGNLTADLGRALGRAVRASVDFGELRGVVTAAARMDSTAARDAASAAVRRASTGDLSRMLGDARHIADVAGPGESVRLLRYARSPQELADLSTMSTRFGRTTRGVVELTGRTSLRAFKGGVRIVRVLAENFLAFMAWFGGLIAMITTRGIARFGWRRIRAKRRTA